MTQTASDLDNTFQRAWSLLIANLIIVLPGIVLGFVAVAAVFFVALFLLGSVAVTSVSGSTSVGVVTIGLTVVIGFAIFALLAILQTAFVTGMAGAAWERGTAAFADGSAAFSQAGSRILGAMLLLLLIGLGALLVSPITLGLSLLAYLVFFLYVMPAVILGGHTATGAISESCRIAARNFWPTCGVALLVTLITIVAGSLGSGIGHYQYFAGGLTAVLIEQAAFAYATLVVVGEYLKLRSAGATTAPQPAAAP